MKSCKDITLLIEKSKEKKLSFRERIQIKMHTKMCKFCHNYNIDSDFLDNLLKQLTPKKLELTSAEKDRLAKQIMDRVS